MRAHRSTQMRSQEREPHLAEPEEAKSTWTCEKGHFVWKFRGKMHRDVSEEPFCVEIYRKKGTGTGHRSHFVPSGNHILEGS